MSVSIRVVPDLLATFRPIDAQRKKIARQFSKSPLAPLLVFV